MECERAECVCVCACLRERKSEKEREIVKGLSGYDRSRK
jgi:hypothetical protein